MEIRRKKINSHYLTYLSYTLLILFSLPHVSQAQDNGARPKIGKITGNVVDAATKEPVEYATISILSRQDSSLITGTVTDMEGKFTIEEIPAGAFRVKVSFIGYRTNTKENLVINQQTPVHNLGTIRLNATAQALGEVVVSAEQPVFEQSIDKRVFNVEKSIVTQGGTATDILETIPSVTVDVDGNLSLRGSGGVVVLIDGKPSSLTGADRAAILDQLPANAIESVEVITNPSARYDAEGMSGIINIVLKKNKLRGSNGTVSLSAGTRDKYNAAVNYNYRTPKFNIFSSYSYRNTSFYSNGYNTRQLMENSIISSYRLQNSNEVDRDQVHIIRAGADYFINEKTTLGFSALYGNQQEREDERIENKLLDAGQNLTRLFYRNNDERQNEHNTDLVLNFSRKFNRPSQELTASAAYSGSRNNTNMLFRNQNFDLDLTPADEFPLLENNIRNIDNTVITLQADYIHPLANEGKLEGGYKSIIREVDNELIFENFNNINRSWAYNDTLSNQFLYQEQVHSLYANYAATLGKIGYQLGTRLEQTIMNPVQRTVEGNFRRNYLGFFPSVFLSYKLKGEQQFQLNYSRRINRPNLRELNPFINYADPLNIRFGNPYLNPEFTNSFEFSYLTGIKNIFLTSSVYYRRTNDIIQRIITVDTSNIATTTFQNLDNRDSYGFEFIAKTTVNKWWSFTTNFNFFRTQVMGNSQQTNFNNANTSWSVMLISNMDIPKIAQVQINGNYRGPVATPQGIMREMYGINVGIKRDVLKGNGSISLNVTDIFNTREFNMVTSDNTFTQRFGRKRETRIATLTLSYKFGKLIDADKRKRSGRDNQNQDMDEDNF